MKNPELTIDTVEDGIPQLTVEMHRLPDGTHLHVLPSIGGDLYVLYEDENGEERRLTTKFITITDRSTP